VPDWLWAALALVMIVEGALPFAAPRVWRETFRKLTELTDGQLRFLGLIARATGRGTRLVIKS
jgi:uncharacterized protein YjeT (DUF2065 family)